MNHHGRTVLKVGQGGLRARYDFVDHGALNYGTRVWASGSPSESTSSRSDKHMNTFIYMDAMLRMQNRW
jgi:hypothetical protein